MKLGFKEAVAPFKEKGFIWFERKILRDEHLLSREEIKWLRGWTFSPIGFAGFLYILSPRRKLYDILTVNIITYLFGEVHDAFLKPLFINDSKIEIDEKYPLGLFPAFFYFLLVGLPFVIASFYAVYFCLRHSKRLAWNRGNWINVEELKKSERKWLYFNTLPSLAIVAVLLFFLFKPL